jgi:N-acetylneuraminate synthase
MMQHRVYIIAEAGVNHNGSIDMAKQLVDVAAGAGADAIKFQTFKAEALVSPRAPKAGYQQKITGTDESQYEMLRKLELDENMHSVLVKHCALKGIQFLSTPFDSDSLGLLVNQFDLPCIKIPSGEITNAPFLLEIAFTGKPVILSTGMCTLAEIETALGVLAFGYLKYQETPSVKAFEQVYATDAGQEILGQKVTLLHCTSEYPAPFEEVNLRAMDVLRSAFGLRVGYSDHTEGIAVPIAAAARGAAVIEKHFTLDRTLPGPDHKASLEPAELKLLIQSIRQVENSLGSGIKKPAKSEFGNRLVARKSLVAARDIYEGEQWNETNLAVKRPGDGLAPLYYWSLLGKNVAKDYKKDEKVLE